MKLRKPHFHWPKGHPRLGMTEAEVQLEQSKQRGPRDVVTWEAHSDDGPLFIKQPDRRRDEG